MNYFFKRILMFAFPLLLVGVPYIVFGQEEGLVQCDGVDVPCDFQELIDLGSRIVDFLFMIAAFVGALMFAYAGYLYITAVGNESQIATATGIFTKVFFGVIIALAAYLVVELIVDTLLKDEISPLTGLLSTWLV